MILDSKKDGKDIKEAKNRVNEHDLLRLRPLAHDICNDNELSSHSCGQINCTSPVFWFKIDISSLYLICMQSL